MNSTFGVDATDFIDKWVAQRAKDASALGKPLVIEEFGKQLQDFSAANIAAVRNPVFQTIYDSLQNLEVVKGTPACDTLISDAICSHCLAKCPDCFSISLNL